jgi:hypothetical protein
MIIDVPYIGVWASFFSAYQQPEFGFGYLWLFFRREKLVLVLRFDLTRWILALQAFLESGYYLYIFIVK